MNFYRFVFNQSASTGGAFSHALVLGVIVIYFALLGVKNVLGQTIGIAFQIIYNACCKGGGGGGRGTRISVNSENSKIDEETVKNMTEKERQKLAKQMHVNIEDTVNWEVAKMTLLREGHCSSYQIIDHPKYNFFFNRHFPVMIIMLLIKYNN